MQRPAAEQPRTADGRFGVRPLAEAELVLGDPDGAGLDLSDLRADEVVDLANTPRWVLGSDPQFEDLASVLELDSCAYLGELADDTETFQSEMTAWAQKHCPEHAEAFVAFAMTELAAAGHALERVGTPEDLHRAYRLEATRARTLALVGDQLPASMAQALLSGLDRSAYGTGPAGAQRRTQVRAAIDRLRAEGVTVAESVEPGRGTVWKVAID
ncbi:hypothetical protein CHO01_22050 [Cellulomonas hominis]|uniref:Uncharacterized protein n=1 Tax=Cellulomonas hominis TaxID=156981 RepID=A0A511FCV6_9CELL|nr:hypothetical protein [Cellulomonas hominis]MBB5474670.1 hypothetical protein [Cellulomonas hominis]NKY05796.1 hypothetical protein [Cellulomonas hominis]GEL47089.1 hypothetical protein CHO01_22050 [Cellulomonas hominis]